MARLTPTVGTAIYNGVVGDRRKIVVPLTIAGTYSAASASDGGALLTPSQVGFQEITHVNISPTFTPDAIEEQPLSVGPSTSSTAGWVFALTNKDDDLETGATAVTGVTFYAEIIGR